MRKERLVAVRKLRGFTQEALAKELGTDKRAISRWEGGLFVPNAETLVQLSRILDVSVDYLLGVSDDPNPSVKLNNMSELELAVVTALRKGDDKEAIRLIANS